MNLHRYIPFSSFVDLVISKELVFLSPLKSWKDGYEGLLFKAMKENLNAVYQKIKHVSGEDIFVTEEMAYFLKAMCWSKNYDSIAMWSTYGTAAETIMIKTTMSKLKSVKLQDKSVEVLGVDYTKPDIDSEIRRAVDGKTINISKLFLSKRTDFSYEDEMRAFISVPIGDDFSDFRLDGKKVLRVNVSMEIGDFIDEVLVHPESKDHFVNVVKILCEQYQIKFNGKSKVYEYNLT